MTFLNNYVSTFQSMDSIYETLNTTFYRSHENKKPDNNLLTLLLDQYFY